jgi:hypothetical protein
VSSPDGRAKRTLFPLSSNDPYCDPSRELSFWRPTPEALLALGLRSHTDIPALKELEEWFDAQKEMRATAKLDPYFERTSRLASRRLKREIERRGTLGEFALEPDPSLKEDPTEESGSDLFQSDGSWSFPLQKAALKLCNKLHYDSLQFSTNPIFLGNDIQFVPQRSRYGCTFSVMRRGRN